MRRGRRGAGGLPRGFSLIEAVFLIVLLGVAAATMVRVFGSITSSQAGVDVRQRGVLLAEACAELVFSSRRLLQTTDEGASPASCSGNTSALCDCAVLHPSYTPYTAALRVSRLGVTSPMPYPALCYAPNNPQRSDPQCVQVEITVSGGGVTFPSVFLQLSER